ncbi:MAG TPA: type II secretion system protein [Verrucomicrobiae bacterium]|nr:type II secretion system protein [Verrucomicrobiae bacterium]
MKRNAGFTLVELLITMTVMVILLVLVVVSLRSNQANARDEERKTDIGVIAQQLENYYEAGTPTTDPGQYPGTADVNTEAEVKALLPDLNSKVLRAPDVADSSAMSFTVATSAAAQTPDTSTYIYQPLKADGSLCTAATWGVTNECREFIIYYALEATSGTQTIKSKHQ